MSNDWQQQRERGSTFAIWILVWVALRLGRRVVQLMLYPIVFYYLLFARRPRKAALQYWKRIGDPKPGWWRLYRHFYTFAAVSVDRFFFLTGRTQGFQIDVHGEDTMQRLLDSGKGCLLLMSHVGSFDVIRAAAMQQQQPKIRLLMDSAHNRRAIQILTRLDPEMSEAIIDAAASPPELALQISDAVKQGHMVGIMADRSRDGEAVIDIKLLNDGAVLPQSTWMLAMALKVPVVMCTGLYLERGRYSVHFEELDIPKQIPRKQRQAQAAAMAQKYADRLDTYLRSAPYNWFNFYPYWNNDSVIDQ